jgi:hypothetical protein
MGLRTAENDADVQNTSPPGTTGTPGRGGNEKDDHLAQILDWSRVPDLGCPIWVPDLNG